MKKVIAFVVPAGIAIFQLGACATTSTPAKNTVAAVPAPKGVNVGDSKTLADVPYGFQLVLQKGEEYYCKRELITGSRTNTRDVCLTKAQMEAQINGTQDYLKRMQDATNGTDSRSNPNGTYNSAITR
jgi:hypothetical protein